MLYEGKLMLQEIETEEVCFPVFKPSPGVEDEAASLEVGGLYQEFRWLCVGSRDAEGWV